MTARCAYSDLPADQCAHCGHQPGTRIVIEVSPGRAGKTARRRNLFIETETPPATNDRPPLKLGTPMDGNCACGQPLRDTAYGCDDCTTELARFLGDLVWLNEQLDTTITRQKGKQPGAGARGNDGLPWHLQAAQVHHDLREYLTNLVTHCYRYKIRNQSPVDGPPVSDSIATVSAWLLWRVDGLQFNDAFPDTLKTALRLEGKVLHAIDRGPDLLYLGICEKTADEATEPCGGAIYAKADEETGKCRACRATYPVDSTRDQLTKKLDDRLCTAAEIAHLATYLGLDVDRRRIQNVVAQWHKRKRITAAPHADGQDPRFRYGDVAILLAQTYAKGA